MTRKSNPITVLVYHRNGTIIECQFRTMNQAREYMDTCLRRNTVAECEYYA